MGNRRAYYVNSEGPDHDAFRKTLAWTISQSTKSQESVTLVLNVKSNLAGVVGDVLGEEVRKTLEKGNSVRLPNNGGTLSVVTRKTMVRHRMTGIALVAYPSPDTLDVVDDTMGFTDVVVIPWLREEVVPWISTWKADEIFGNPMKIKVENIDPALKDALNRIHTTVNVSTGISHPLDKKHAIRILKGLSLTGAKLSPDATRSYLIGEKGWRPEDADDVVEIVKKLSK